MANTIAGQSNHPKLLSIWYQVHIHIKVSFWVQHSRHSLDCSSVTYPSSILSYGSVTHPSSTPSYGSVTHPSSTPSYGSVAHPSSTPSYGSVTNPSSTPSYGSVTHPSSTPFHYALQFVHAYSWMLFSSLGGDIFQASTLDSQQRMASISIWETGQPNGDQHQALVPAGSVVQGTAATCLNVAVACLHYGPNSTTNLFMQIGNALGVRLEHVMAVRLH